MNNIVQFRAAAEISEPLAHLSPIFEPASIFEPAPAHLDPAPPESIAETGLDSQFLLTHLIKTIFRAGLNHPREMARVVKLPREIIDSLITTARAQGLIELDRDALYALTPKGEDRAVEALARNGWTGPAPVSLAAFAEQAASQSIQRETLTRPMLDLVLSELTLAPELLDRLGPAVNSTAAVLLYGPPGNGKSSIAEAICSAFCDHVYIPHAIAVAGEVIKVSDPGIHNPVDDLEEEWEYLSPDESFDRRFVLCRRPAVIAGGELTPDRLDLATDPISGVHEAPLQLKAAGGVLVIDDLGRQRQSPQELFDRLTVPLEQGIDYLSLPSGRLFEVPFDALTVFSANIPPQELLDGATLRRLRYKILVDRPNRKSFIKIFVRAVAQYRLTLDMDTLSFILFKLYGTEPRAEFHAFHPGFLIEQTRAICAYERVPMELKPEYLEQAWGNLYPRD